MESSRNYERFGNRPFPDDLPRYAQEQSWYPYRFLLVWDKTRRNDKSSRARTLYSSYKKGCTFLPLKRPLPFALPNHCLGKKEYCLVDSDIQKEMQVAKEVQFLKLDIENDLIFTMFQ